MSLLDSATLAEMSGQPAYNDPAQYDSAYLDAVLASVEQQVARYLQFVPWLSVHTNETGPVHWLDSGPYAGRYLLTLRHRPLVPGGPTAVFTSLSLTYALALTLPSTVTLADTVVEEETARVYSLAPGFVDSLSGIGFAYGGSQRGIFATGYRSSYTAGWSTGISDPTLPGGASYGADSIPADLQYAASLLAQECLAVQAAQNADLSKPFPGLLVSQRIGQRQDHYQPLVQTSSAPLGYGGPLSQQAASILQRYRKAPAAVLV